MNRALAIEEYTIQLMQYSLLPNTNASILTAVEYITFEQLSVFIEQHCLSYIDIEHRIVKSFVEFYTVTTALKFAFYMDVHNRNMMSIRRLAHSDTMVELQSLISISRYLSSKSKGGGFAAGRVIGYDIYEDKRFLKDQMDHNWFSPTNVINIYTIFLQLDEDKNGK